MSTPPAVASPPRSSKSVVLRILLGGCAVVVLYLGGCTASVARVAMASDQLKAPVAERLMEDVKLRAQIGEPISVTDFHAPGLEVKHVVARVTFNGSARGPKGEIRFGGDARSFYGLPWTVRNVEWADAEEAARQDAERERMAGEMAAKAALMLLPQPSDAH